MGNEPLIPKPTSPSDKLKQNDDVIFFFIAVLLLLVLFSPMFISHQNEEEKAPDIRIPSMDFTVFNMTETCLSVKWDILIRIPPKFPGFYVCLEGDIKVFILYKGVTIATSPIESYTLKLRWPKLLKVSLVASKGEMDGAIVKNIVEDIKERGETRFGSLLLLPDCRYGTSGKMNYACDEAMLRFEPVSQRNATLFGNQPKCIYQHP